MEPLKPAYSRIYTRGRPVACAICGRDFTAHHPREKLCSDACRAVRAKSYTKKPDPLATKAYRAALYAANREKVKARVREYAKSDAGKRYQAERSRRRRVTEKEKISARTALNNALRYGGIVRGPCRDCGATNAHGHHVDYSRPLDVIWLCPQHHADEHRRLDNGS